MNDRDEAEKQIEDLEARMDKVEKRLQYADELERRQQYVIRTLEKITNAMFRAEYGDKTPYEVDRFDLEDCLKMLKDGL